MTPEMLTPVRLGGRETAKLVLNGFPSASIERVPAFAPPLARWVVAGRFLEVTPQIVFAQRSDVLGIRIPGNSLGGKGVPRTEDRFFAVVRITKRGWVVYFLPARRSPPRGSTDHHVHLPGF